MDDGWWLHESVAPPGGARSFRSEKRRRIAGYYATNHPILFLYVVGFLVAILESDFDTHIRIRISISIIPRGTNRFLSIYTKYN